jgi:ankyrin repeat protein
MALMVGSYEILEELLAWKPMEEHRRLAASTVTALCTRSSKNFNSDSSSVPNTNFIHKYFGRVFPSAYERNGSTTQKKSHPQNSNLGLEDWNSVLVQRGHYLYTPLHYACLYENDLAIVFLLDVLKPEDLRLTDQCGDTPLHVFAKRPRIKMFHVSGRLVAASAAAATNVKNTAGDLPIHIVSRKFNDDDGLFPLLVDHTSDLDEEGGSGETVLEIVAKRDLTGRLARLLAAGRVDVLRRNKMGLTVFSTAAGCAASRTILELLYSADASLACLSDDTPYRLTPLHHLLEPSEYPSCQAEKLKYLLSLPEAIELAKGFLSSPVTDNPARSAQLLEFSIENGFDTVAKAILQSGVVDISQGSLEMKEAAERLGYRTFPSGTLDI